MIEVSSKAVTDKIIKLEKWEKKVRKDKKLMRADVSSNFLYRDSLRREKQNGSLLKGPTFH